MEPNLSYRCSTAAICASENNVFFGIALFRRQSVQLFVRRPMLSYVLLILSLILLKGQTDAEYVIYGISQVEMFALWFFIFIISQMIHASVLIDNIVFRTFGKYSYGIFLFQFIWINIYMRYINYQGVLAEEIKCATSIVALLAISIILNYSIEKPIHKVVMIKKSCGEMDK